MNTSLFGLLTVSSLLLLTGCASSQSRSQASNPNQSTSQIACESHPSQATLAGEDPGADEMVIGSMVHEEVIPVYPDPIEQYSIDDIRAELEAMYDFDRELVAQLAHPTDPNLQAPTIRAIDQAQSDRLKEIVAHIGWPTRDLVGLKATQGAYMVIQHAGHDTEFQNECLSMMVDLVEQGELPASYVALLTDRIRVFQDRPQLFGTQMEMALNEQGIMVPTPSVQIEDPEHLDERRALMGMPPHKEFVEAIELAYEASLIDPNSAYATVPTDD
ncbi:MAG: DUF6624 domain-containing protein [Phycisphaerales bacterium]